YIQIRFGTPSSQPAHNNMHHNFIVANYGADGGCFDHDDGSSYYLMHHNFCVYGGVKNNFDGHSKIAHSSLYVYPYVFATTCIGYSATVMPPNSYHETYQGNKCILPYAGAAYLNMGELIDITDKHTMEAGLFLANNTVYCPGGVNGARVTGMDANMEKVNITLAEYLRWGHDPSLTVNDTLPRADEVLDMARAMLKS
ncbi:hypothetical protein AAMO2058_001615200, partial [Amorphochlora amoebiformis]